MAKYSPPFTSDTYRHRELISLKMEKGLHQREFPAPRLHFGEIRRGHAYRLLANALRSGRHQGFQFLRIVERGQLPSRPRARSPDVASRKGAEQVGVIPVHVAEAVVPDQPVKVSTTRPVISTAYTTTWNAAPAR